MKEILFWYAKVGFLVIVFGSALGFVIASVITPAEEKQKVSESMVYHVVASRVGNVQFDDRGEVMLYEVRSGKDCFIIMIGWKWAATTPLSCRGKKAEKEVNRYR